MIAIDLPGFGDSDKPLGAAYDAPYFAAAQSRPCSTSWSIERAHLIGNSMGGRVAIEAGLRDPDRVGQDRLLSPALAWLRDRRWAGSLQPPLPQLGLFQPAPRVITRADRPQAGPRWQATAGPPPASTSSCAPT